MRRILVAAVGMFAIGCFWPTDVCGCIYLPPPFYLVGTVVDGKMRPMPGVRVHITPTRSADPPSTSQLHGSQMQADGAGVFRGIVDSPYFHRGWLHATVIRTDPADTIRLPGAETSFTPSHEFVDTLRMTFQVPTVESATQR